MAGIRQNPAPAFHLAALLLVLLYADATVHSIDQIRDLNVARALADGTSVPDASPRFSDRYTLPPYFYFLLAIPLWLGAQASLTFIAFGLCHVLAVAWSGRWLARERLGSEPVFAAVGYGFPILFLAHSAWNNGHLYAWNCLLLVATLRAWRSGGWWIALQAALLVLVCTISPSAVPFVLTTLLLLLRHGRDPRAWASIALAAVVHAPMFGFWLRHDPNAPALVAGAGGSEPFAERVAAFATNLAQLAKWRDAWFLAATQAREMVGAWAGWLVAGALAVITALAALAVVRAVRSREGAPGRGETLLLAGAVGAWWVVAMGALPLGAFYYLYTVLPWVAALAAAGAGALWRTAGPRGRARVALLGLGLVLAQAIPLGMLYRTVLVEGIAKVTYASMAFPDTGSGTRVSWIPYRYQQELVDALRVRGACAGRVVGPWAEQFELYTFDAELPACDGGGSPALFVLFRSDQPDSGAVAGRQPLLRNRLARVYEIPAAELAGVVSYREARERITYAVRRGAPLPPALEIAVPEGAARALATLRCEGAPQLTVEQAARRHGTATAQPPFVGVEEMGFRFIWADVPVTGDGGPLALSFEPSAAPVRCDLSVVLLR